MTGPWVAAFIALAGLVVVLALVVLGTLRRVIVVLDRAELRLRDAEGPGGLEAGAELPYFVAESPDGVRLSSSDLIGAPTVILFTSPKCPACRALEESLRQHDTSELESKLVVVLNDSSDVAELAATSRARVLVQADRAISMAFDSHVTPHGFAVSADGRIAGSGTPNTFESLCGLVGMAEGGDRPNADLVGIGIA